MYIACLGDSLTEGDYGVLGKRGIANVNEKNYPYFLSKLIDAEVKNYGRCGANPTSYLEYYMNGNIDVSNADIIIIMLGTNGGLNLHVDAKGNEDYGKLVDKCREDAPNAKIVLCAPPRATENQEYSNCGYMPQIKKAVEFVRNFASENNHHLIDVFDFEGFNSENEAIMQPNDGLHFGELGYKTLAEFIYNELIKLFPDIA